MWLGSNCKNRSEKYAFSNQPQNTLELITCEALFWIVYPIWKYISEDRTSLNEEKEDFFCLPVVVVVGVVSRAVVVGSVVIISMDMVLVSVVVVSRIVWAEVGDTFALFITTKKNLRIFMLLQMAMVKHHSS